LGKEGRSGEWRKKEGNGKGREVERYRENSVSPLVITTNFKMV